MATSLLRSSSDLSSLSGGSSFFTGSDTISFDTQHIQTSMADKVNSFVEKYSAEIVMAMGGAIAVSGGLIGLGLLLFGLAIFLIGLSAYAYREITEMLQESNLRRIRPEDMQLEQQVQQSEEVPPSLKLYNRGESSSLSGSGLGSSYGSPNPVGHKYAIWGQPCTEEDYRKFMELRNESVKRDLQAAKARKASN